MPKAPKTPKAPDKSCPPGADPLAPFGRNSRGRPYKRSCGSYKPAIPQQQRRPSKDTGDLAKIVEKLTTDNRALQEQLITAKADLSALKAVEGGSADVARWKGEATKHEEYHKAYMAGLEKGLSMATGQICSTRTPASGGSARSAAV